MKIALLTCCILPLLAPVTQAGINGTYKVRGIEKDNGKNYSFTGTVKVSGYNKGKYSLRFNDGENATFEFTFSQKLKDDAKSQTVSYSSKLGTGKATFKLVGDQYKVDFTYKAKGANIQGSGSGSKKL